MVISIITLAVAIGISTFISYQSLTKEASKYNKAVSADFAGEVNLRILDRVNALAALSQTEDIRSMDTAGQLEAITAVSGRFEDMPRVFVTDALGQQLVASSGTLSNIADRPYFKQLLNGAPFAISDVLVSKGNGKNSLVISVPIKNEQGSLAGTLAASVDLEFMSKAVAERKMSTSGYIYITDNQGKILAHPDMELVKE